MPLLEVKGLTKRFGKLVALDDINLKIEESELIGLVGPNGSGKTTLFNILSGYYHPSAGEVIYKGERISGLRPDEIARKGIMRAFQTSVLFHEVTVFENILRGCFLLSNTNLGQVFFNTRAYQSEEWEMMQRVDRLLHFWDLYEWREQLAGSLPHGLQRVLGLAVAMAPNPKLLLLDEPLTGMNAEEVAIMCDHIKRVSEEGITIILVEHNVRSVINICPKLVVLNFGNKIAEGASQEVVRNAEVITAYLGGEIV